MEDDSGSQAGQHVYWQPGLRQGSEQAIVTEPTVANHQYGCADEVLGDCNQHLCRLGEFGLKGDGRAGFNRVNRVRLDILLHEIETKGQWYTAPATFDPVQQSDRNDLLRPGVTGRFEPGRVVMEESASENLTTHLGIDGIIQRQQQSPLDGGIGNERPQHAP